MYHFQPRGIRTAETTLRYKRFRLVVYIINNNSDISQNNCVNSQGHVTKALSFAEEREVNKYYDYELWTRSAPYNTILKTNGCLCDVLFTRLRKLVELAGTVKRRVRGDSRWVS